MRASLIAFVALLSIGCGKADVTTTHPTHFDFSVPQPDFAMTPRSSCSQIIGCAATCTGATCRNDCQSIGNSAAIQAYQAFFTCMLAQCDTSSSDGGAVCADANDTSADCNTCLQGAINSSACQAQLAACDSQS